MGKGSKSGACKSASHQLYRDRAKNRVDDLQGMFNDLQWARKESRTVDAAVLEEQVHQMLREWKAELTEPSPASSLQQGGSLLFSSEICRLLQLCEEEDDATSPLAAPKPEPDVPKALNESASQEGFNVSKGPQEQGFSLVDQCKGGTMGVDNIGMSNVPLATQLDYHSLDFQQEFEQQYFLGFDSTAFVGNDMYQISSYQQNLSPPLSAFLGPKCALWDCPRPALGLDWSQKSDDYCSLYHAGLAPNEGYLGSPPVIRPGGIGLKDNLLFAALGAKAQGKDVGIPECEGAATAKSPWNAPELFDLIVLDGETIREWLFFDKPRRAFESGNRKQRSLPDYTGRGWHESRKQVMNEFGGLKRSYYMDPQPMECFEWHLYEYEINKYDACALYRLEIKRVEGKRTPKGKLSNDSVANLQKQMGRLNAEFPINKQRAVKGRGKGNLKDETGRIYSASNALASPGEVFSIFLPHFATLRWLARVPDLFPSSVTEVQNGNEDLLQRNKGNESEGISQLKVSMNVRFAVYNLDGGKWNRRDYLSAGKAVLPRVYFLFSTIYFVLAAVWIYVLYKKRLTVFKIHFFMLAVVILKMLNLLCEAEDKSYIKRSGSAHGWDVLFYIFSFLKGITLFTLIVLIGTGWSFLKPYLQDREKKVLIIVIPLQVIANIAQVAIDETVPYAQEWATWKQVFLLVDVICCCAVLFPIVWSIKNLREAARTDGKAAVNLMKLTLFRQYYIVVICYIYFTRVVVYALETITSYKYFWTSIVAGELATLAFYAFTGYKFKPEAHNPYFVIDDEDEVAAAEQLKLDDEFEL